MRVVRVKTPSRRRRAPRVVSKKKIKISKRKETPSHQKYQIPVSAPDQRKLVRSRRRENAVRRRLSTTNTSEDSNLFDHKINPFKVGRICDKHSIAP
jgi:hypothetical protein